MYLADNKRKVVDGIHPFEQVKEFPAPDIFSVVM